MVPTIRASTWNSREQRYRDILQADYTQQSLNETLALLWSVIGHSVPKVKPEWRTVLEYSENGKVAPTDFNPETVGRIKEFASFFGGGPLPSMPSTFSGGRPSRVAWQAERTWTYLVLQSLASLKGDTGFFQDIQSLLFLCASYYLLPHLTSQRLHPEHDCLINAMYMHTFLIWRDDPAHQFYLQSLIMDCLGEAQARLDLLHQSFLLTPPDDHSYLTKAQSYWGDLLEAGKREQAMSFLVNLARISPRENIPEIKEMLDDLLNAANASRV